MFTAVRGGVRGARRALCLESMSLGDHRGSWVTKGAWELCISFPKTAWPYS